MTDANLMDADCIHGVTWWRCRECSRQVDVSVPIEHVRAIVGWWRNATEGPGGCSYAEAIKGMGPHVKALHDIVGEG